MMLPASREKFTAKPGVLEPNNRVTGFNSRPPDCRFARVTKKSAVLNAAVAAKSARFLLSQKRWRCEVSCGALTNETGAGEGLRASGAPFPEDGPNELCWADRDPD